MESFEPDIRMIWPKNGLAHCLLLFLACFPAWQVNGQQETPFTRLFDTAIPSVGPLPEEAFNKQTGWRLIPEDKVDHQFSGDAVLLNDKVAVVLRKQGSGAEVYAKGAAGFRSRASVGYLTASFSATDPLATLKIIENASGAVMVEASSKNNSLTALRFRLTTGEAILEIRSNEGIEFVKVQTRTRYVVVPDYFGDDMVFGVQAFRELALPAENFCLNLIEGGDAIVMNVWQSSEQEAWLGTPAKDKEDLLCSSRIRCLNGKSIWLAFLEGPGIWHAGNAAAKDGWKPPFPAKWRCSLVRENGVADSWDLERGPAPQASSSQREEALIKSEMDQSLLTSATTAKEGPLIVYPIDRSSATPLTASCPTDVMRNTLGVGPCQYILACEGLGAQGDPTPNAVMNWVEKQFEQKKEKKAADDIKERLEVMVEHVAQARGRIDRYAKFAGEARQQLANKESSAPFRLIADDLDRFVASGLTPAASPERARQLAWKVSALTGTPDALAGCRQLGEQLRSLGAIQDGALARCRMAVRRLKQQGRTLAANQATGAGLAQEVQRLAEQMLQEKPGKTGEAK